MKVCFLRIQFSGFWKRGFHPIAAVRHAFKTVSSREQFHSDKWMRPMMVMVLGGALLIPSSDFASTRSCREFMGSELSQATCFVRRITAAVWKRCFESARVALPWFLGSSTTMKVRDYPLKSGPSNSPCLFPTIGTPPTISRDPCQVSRQWVEGNFLRCYTSFVTSLAD